MIPSREDFKKVDQKTLREFGIILGVGFPLFFGLLLPWIFNYPFPLWPLYVPLPAIGLGLLFPRALMLVYVPWMLVGGVLGYINTRIILSLVYYLIFTPVSLIFKLMGRDSMRRRLENSQTSYRVIPEDEDARGKQRAERMKFPF